VTLFKNKNSDEFKKLLERYEDRELSDLVQPNDMKAFQSIYYFACKEESKNYKLSMLSVPNVPACNKVFQLLKDENGIFVIYEAIPTACGNVDYNFNCSLETSDHEIADDFIKYELRAFQTDRELTNLVDLFYTAYDD